MKRTTFFPLALMLALTVSCEEDLMDKPDDGNTNIADTAHIVPPRYLSLNALTAWFETEYSISFIIQFKDDDYTGISEGMVMPYTPATDTTRVKRLLYYIGDYVLNVFPARVVAKYMPPTVYVVDSLKATYSLWDDQTTPGKTDRRSWHIPITGQTTGEYLVIGNAGPRFDDKKEGLREELISLFVDRLLYNTTLPRLTDFQKITEEATTASGAEYEYSSGGYIFKVSMNYPYWDGLSDASSSTEPSSGASWASYGTMDNTIWIGRGIRKVGRAGYIGREYRSLMGSVMDSYEFMKATVKQDFADFAAFIITTPTAEREAYYAQVDADKRCNIGSPNDDQLSGVTPFPTYLFQQPPDTAWYDARFPFAGTLGANAMRAKDAYVKAYFKANLEIELE
jgi:hypothetical protein